jgi:hypothetical protein
VGGGVVLPPNTSVGGGVGGGACGRVGAEEGVHPSTPGSQGVGGEGQKQLF